MNHLSLPPLNTRVRPIQLLWLLALVACNDPPARGGGTAVVGYLAEASSMNEFASTDGISDQLQSFVLFTTLVRYDDALEPAPYLAESWDTATVDSQFTLTFRLRRDVAWHDGAPTTAADVAFTLNTIKALGNRFPRAAAFSEYDSAVAVDSFTVRMHLSRHPGYLDPWTFTSPMPAHRLASVPLSELQSDPLGKVNPVGNGPFRFVEHRPGERWVFEANEDFPEALGGRPNLDRLIYRVIVEPNTMLVELLSGGVDVYLGIAPAQVARVEENDAARVLRFTSRRYAFINWNSRRPLFADTRVRRALTLAIDRRRMVDAVRYGLGVVAHSPVPPLHPAHHASLAPLPFDPDQARVLLDSAGWLDADADGVRERGRARAELELLTNSNPVREEIIQIVAHDLAQVGVAVRPRVLEAQALGAIITDPGRDFDAFVLGWEPSLRHDDRLFFGCGAPEGPYQWSGYCDERVAEILSELAVIEDPALAQPLWEEYQSIIQRDQPYTFIYYEVQPNGVSARLKGVEMDIRGNFISVADWWIAREES